VDGQIREIAPQADAVTRTRRVRIALSDPPSSFRLGATVTANPRNTENSTLRLPASAVLTRDGQGFVWVVDPTASTVSLRNINFTEDEGGVQVISGVSAGARIVTAGIHSLKQGQKVRIEQDSTP
jgi:membrane fusion protein, multidrug efflux system